MKIALKAYDGRFVCADDSVRGIPTPEHPLIANRASAGAWETFELMTQQPDGSWIPFDPTPAPPPAPPVADEPWAHCTPTEDVSIVACVKSALPPQPQTPAGAFEITKRVAWLLRSKGVGLLLKPSGENIVTWGGISYSAGRVCYENGRIIKILTDVPTTNGPQWSDNNDLSGAWSRAIDPSAA